MTVFPWSCKAECEARHSIEFLLNTTVSEKCPKWYETKSPPLDKMVKGKKQCNIKDGESVLCSYCWESIHEFMPNGISHEKEDTEKRYKFRRSCNYIPPDACTLYSLNQGTCSKCS